MPRRHLGWLATALALGVGIAAIVILPAAAGADAGARAHALSRDVAEGWSVRPRRLPELAAAVDLGGVFAGHADEIENVYGAPPLAFSYYLGGSVLALAAFAFGRKRGLAIAIGTCALFALLLAMGRYTPLHALVRAVVRPLAYMRYPEKYLALVVPPLALLAGLGATRLSERPPGWRLLAIAAAASAAAIVAAWRPPALAHALRMGSVHAGLGVAGIGLAWFLARRYAACVAIAVVALDLITFDYQLQKFGPASILGQPPPLAQTILAVPSPAPPRLYRGARVQSALLRAGGLAVWNPTITLRDNTGGPFGIANLPGFEASLPQAYQDLVHQAPQHGAGGLRLLGVEYALLTVGEGAAPAREGLIPVFDPLPGSRLYRVEGPLPRAYLAGEHAPSGDVFDPAVVAGERVLLDGPAGGTPGRAGNCTIAAFELSRIEARCAAERPATAVFVEQWAPGWQAMIDGAPAPLLRANLVMRAVAVPAGDHLITLSFHPPGLFAGLIVSLASLAALALACLIRR